MKPPPRQQAVWLGDHPDPEAPGCWHGCLNGVLFMILGLVIGAICAWLWLHQAGTF